MQIKRIVSISTVERLKQKARKLKRERAISHTEALDFVARTIGFDHWHQVTLACEPYRLADEAFSNGCVLAFDQKESLDVDTRDGQLVNDPILDFLAKNKLTEIFGNFVDEDDPLGRRFKDTLSAEELEHEVQDYFEFEFFRIVPGACEFSLKKVLSYLRDYTFWMPNYIWVKGELIDCFDLPSVDEDEDLVDLRL